MVSGSGGAARGGGAASSTDPERGWHAGIATSRAMATALAKEILMQPIVSSPLALGKLGVVQYGCRV